MKEKISPSCRSSKRVIRRPTETTGRQERRTRAKQTVRIFACLLACLVSVLCIVPPKPTCLLRFLPDRLSRACSLVEADILRVHVVLSVDVLEHVLLGDDAGEAARHGDEGVANAHAAEDLDDRDDGHVCRQLEGAAVDAVVEVEALARGVGCEEAGCGRADTAAKLVAGKQQRRLKLVPANIALHKHVVLVVDERETRVVVAVEQRLDGLQGVAVELEDLQLALAAALVHLAEQVAAVELGLVVEERVAVEVDVGLVDTLVVQPVAHPLGDDRSGHERQDVRQAASHLKHDDDERDSHAHEPAERGRSADHGVEARLDAGLQGRAGLGDDLEVRVVAGKGLDSDADDAAKGSADAHRRDEEAGRHVGARGERGEDAAEERGKGQQANKVAGGRVAHLVGQVTDGVRAVGEHRPHHRQRVATSVRVRVGADGGDEGEEDNLDDRRLAQPGALAEAAHQNVELAEERAKETAAHADEGERQELKPVPRGFVGDVEGHLAGRDKGVHGAEDGKGDEGAEEGAPHGLVREVVRDFLQAEKHAADGGAEGDRHAGSGGGREHLALLGLVVAVLGEEAGDEVAAAAGNVDGGALLAEAEARGRGENHGCGLDNVGPEAKVAADDKAAENGLELGNATAARVGGQAPAEDAGGGGKEDGEHGVGQVVEEVGLVGVAVGGGVLGPAAPRAARGLRGGGLGPAAVVEVEPPGAWAVALADVDEPGGANVADAGGEAGKHADERDNQPALHRVEDLAQRAAPRVLAAALQRVLPVVLLDRVARPVDRRKVLVLAPGRDVRVRRLEVRVAEADLRLVGVLKDVRRRVARANIVQIVADHLQRRPILVDVAPVAVLRHASDRAAEIVRVRALLLVIPAAVVVAIAVLRSRCAQ
eukprot:m.158875 g.158875  ORF g.158875 m.158875 type:complete len:882 (-) comp17030_c0_seq3:557-3202(-)